MKFQAKLSDSLGFPQSVENMWESYRLSEAKLREAVSLMEDRMAGSAANPWEEIKNRLVSKVTTRAYDDWVARTTLDGMDGQTARVTVPDQVTKDWMEQEYGELVRQTIADLKLPIENVTYVLRASASVAQIGRAHV